MGELSVWTGKNGEGKSTFLGQMLLEAIDQGKSVCAYSGELRADRFQYWINLQASGSNHINQYYDQQRGKEVAYVDQATVDMIKAWYRGKFWLYDNNMSADNAEETSILRLFKYAARRYDCKVYLVDNLMTSRFDGKNDSDYYRAQSSFVGELISFAKTFNVHVHLVAHPRKTKGDISKDDISGTSDITNRADNVFSIERVSEDREAGFDTRLTILKNRSEGVKDEEMGFIFDKTAKRFWLLSEPYTSKKEYGWNK